MPSTPTTKSQVQAYRFVLRRMQSALVRKDPVMLHDPMRTHGRATTVGVVLGALGCLGFLVFGIFKPAPKVPDSGIVISEQSGQVYVVHQAQGGDKRLIPTFNVASAKLLSMAQAQQGSEGGEGGGQLPQAPEPGDLEPQVVPDTQLVDIGRERLRGIPDGPPLLPTGEQAIGQQWAVCDNLNYDSSLPDQTARQEAVVKSQVLAGESGGSSRDELPRNQAILAKASKGDDGTVYLIYRQADTQAGQGDAVKAPVNMAPNDPIVNAFGLSEDGIRNMSPSLLEAIPNASGELIAPDVPGAGSSPQDFDVASARIGSVLEVQDAGSTTYYVVLQQGVQEINEGAASVLLAADENAATARRVGPGGIASAPKVAEGDQGWLELDHLPVTGDLEVVDQELTPHTCLGWSVEGEGRARDSVTRLYVHNTSPLPNGANPIDVSTPAPDGYNQVDQFYMQPGHAAVVRAATTQETFDGGPLQLVSDRGIRYSIPDVTTAEWLGLSGNMFKAAPETILKMLPAGSSLNYQDVRQTYDSVQVRTPGVENGAAAAGG
ncbi:MULTISPECIES: type VII secretion protein EccB [Prauserella salsuginis group]|nr:MULTISPECIES: type VII secretion protein EccB [Prauserella salsuginis group]MCR3719810.1 type VII secretion protein EccB [Prauserella flava]MCR3736647.1 type VII secretion protein EccB [Prauserella salsuginis]